MKPLKNNVSVKGSKDELEAFASLLESAGFVADKEDQHIADVSTWAPHKTHLLTYNDGTYGYYNHEGEYMDFRFKLPEQTDQAFKAATETITEIEDETI